MNAILFAIFNPEGQNCIKVQLLPYIETIVKTGPKTGPRVSSPGKLESKRALSVPYDSTE